MRLQRNTSNIQVSAIITKFTPLKTSNLKIFLITLLRSIIKSHKKIDMTSPKKDYLIVSKHYVFNFVDVVFLFCSLVPAVIVTTDVQ